MRLPILRLAALAVPTFALVVACGGGAKSGGGSTTGSSSGGGGAEGKKAPKKKDDTRVLATIGSETITVTDFEDHIKRQSPFVRRRYEDAEQRKKLLDDLVRREVMAQEAARLGYDQHPEVQETMKKVMVQKLIREEFDKGYRNMEVPEDELRKYYDEHESDYHQPEMVRLSHIFFKGNPGNKAASKKEAGDVLKDLKLKTKDYNAFREAAKKYSDATDVKTTAGDLNYKSRKELEEKLTKAVADAGFSLKTVGDLSEVIETPDGFHLLKLTGRRRAIDRSFEQVKNQIKNRISREKRTTAYDSYVAGLEKNAKPVMKLELLAEVKIPGGGADAKPAPRPAGSDDSPAAMKKVVPAPAPAKKDGE